VKKRCLPVSRVRSSKIAICKIVMGDNVLYLVTAQATRVDDSDDV
jgi:hypothetical protein